MAKLLIFRGETELDQRELTGQTVRIGRAPQNEIVLEDPGKGVSRHHAEIRFEGGRYILTDLQSQNGIWVSGARVPSVVLEPGVSAALGPFRLMVEAPAPVSPAAPVSSVSAVDPATELTQMSSRTAAPLVLDSLGPPPEKPASPKPAIAKPAVAKPAPAPAQKPPAKEQPRPADARVLVGVVAAIVLIAASALVGYRFMHRPAKPVWDVTTARVLVAGGKCQEALNTQINPALQADPNNQQAIALRDECSRLAQASTSTITSTIPAGPTPADRLNEAEQLMASNVAADCQTAIVTLNAVLAEDANNERAKDLLTKANACVTPVSTHAPPPVSADKPAVALPSSQGGLEVVAGETDKAYKARVLAMRKKYDDAVAVLGSQKFAQAMKLLDDIVSDVPSGYLELQQHRDEARAGLRAEAKIAFAAADVAESKGDFDTAIEQYHRAHQLDQSLQVDAAIQRVTNAKLSLGRKRCSDGKLEFAFAGNTPAAIAAFQDAARLLQGTNDPCYATAREHLQKIGK